MRCTTVTERWVCAGDINGFILTILVLFIAAGGGIGGGGAIIPLYLLFLGAFHSHQSLQGIHDAIFLYFTS